MNQDSRPGPGKGLGIYLPLLVVTLLVHLPSLWIPFQFDDFHHLKENPAIASLQNVPRFFVDPRLFTGRAQEGMYRPLLMTSHALTYAAFGPGPMGFHLASLFLHLVNAVLAAALLRRWTGSDRAAVLGGLFWSLAAVQHETVGYLSARSSLLATTFIFAAVLVTEGQDRRLARALAGCLFFALALLAKEIAFVVPLLILVRDLALVRPRGIKLSARWPIYAATFGLMPVYLLVRYLVLGAGFGHSIIPRQLYLFTQPRVVFWYLGKTALPVNLTLYTDQMLIMDIFSFSTLAWTGAVAAVAIAGVVLLKKQPPLGLGLLWFLICLLPSSTLVPLFLVASIERLYPGLLGLVFLAHQVWVRLPDRGPGRMRAAPVLAAAVILLNSLITVHRHLAWCSGVGLMRDLVRKAPTLSTPWTWLGIMLMKDADYPAARKYLLKALLINPLDSVAHESLTEVYVQTGNRESARQNILLMLKDDNVPEDQKVASALKLAGMELEAKNYARARELAELILKNQPDNVDAYLILANVSEKEGDLEAATADYRRALEIYPDLPEAELQLGTIAYRQHNLAEARNWLERVARRGLPWPEVYVNLGFVAFQEGKIEEAKTWFERALALDPDDPFAHYGLAGCAAATHDLAGMKTHLEKAVAKNPGLSEAVDLLAKFYLDRVQEGGLEPGARDEYLERARALIRRLKSAGQGLEREKQWTQVTGQPLE